MAKITIFGLAGTGTSTVGKMLAEKLGYQFVSTGDLFRAKAKDMGSSLSEFHERAKSDPDFDKKLDFEVKKIGEESNNFVIESRLAWYFIPDSMKIKLDCDFETRVERLAGRDQLSIEDAKTHVIEREKADDERYKTIYTIENISSDSHFDIIIDTTNLAPDQIISKIIALVNKK